MSGRVWCVRYRDGWCAVAGNTEPDEAEINAPTVCDHFIILPGGAERRAPTCRECLAAIKEATRAT